MLNILTFLIFHTFSIDIIHILYYIFLKFIFSSFTQKATDINPKGHFEMMHGKAKERSLLSREPSMANARLIPIPVTGQRNCPTSGSIVKMSHSVTGCQKKCRFPKYVTSMLPDHSLIECIYVWVAGWCVFTIILKIHLFVSQQCSIGRLLNIFQLSINSTSD